MIPVSGSAYTYAYATMGELVAWIIGWDLVLEYSVAATTVSISWSRYLVVFLEQFGIQLPHALTACPWDGGVANLPAALIVCIMSVFLIRGTRESSLLNAVIVTLKVGVILVFIVLGWQFIRPENYHPYLPANTGNLGEFGWSGVLRGAAIVFFAFLGFDSISTTAQETKNPRRDMPIGILGSLLVCTILYTLFGHVMTGVANYQQFGGHEALRRWPLPLPRWVRAARRPSRAQQRHPHCHPHGLLFGHYGRAHEPERVFLAMSRDGLLPPFFSRIHRVSTPRPTVTFSSWCWWPCWPPLCRPKLRAR